MNTAARAAVMNLKNWSLAINFLPALSVMARKRRSSCPDPAGTARAAALKAWAPRLLREEAVPGVRAETAAAAIDVGPFPSWERFSLFLLLEGL